MFSTTRIIRCITFLNFLVFVQCAPELPAEDSYGIISTESAIRNTVNNLFSTLKLKVIQNRLKLKQFSRIHNFFVSITLRNHNDLKKIAKLTEADNIDNGTQVFITQLNEVLNEDNKSNEETDSVYVIFLIEDFINRLDYLKDSHDFKNNTKNFDLNKAIIRYFDKTEFDNATHSNEELAKRNDSNVSVLSDNNEIWQPSGRRIFKGEETEIITYPFMASVQFFRKFQCGSSIIKSDLLITSASCLQIAWNNRFFRENPLFLSVQVGSRFYDHGGEHIPVMEVYFHPSYAPKTLRHNLAIMRLKNVLKFDTRRGKVKKIGMDTNPWPLPSNVQGVVIVGWGVKTFAGTVVTARKNKLSDATLEFYPLEECQEIYSKEFVTDRNFCAGFFSKGAGACNHDSGGPGVVGGILMGVISFGSPVCGTVDAPTVFTKLGYYTDWIEGIMEMKVPKANQQTTLRPHSLPTFRLPPVTYRTTMKILPIINRNPTEKPDVLRTNDEKREFKQFLETFFEENNEQKTLEEETEEATESSYESEVIDFPYESQEVTDSPDQTQKVNEIHNFKVQPILRNKPITATEKENTPSTKTKWSAESQSQSEDDSEDKTTSIQPSAILESEKNTILYSKYDKKTSPSTVDLSKEASTSQDTEFDEAIESLIDTLNIDFESDSDLTDRRKHKAQSDYNPKLVKKVNNESYSTNTQENEDSEEIVQTVHKNNKNQRHKTGEKDRKLEEDKTAEEYKIIRIPAESLEKENSSSNNTKIENKLQKNKNKSYSSKRGDGEHHNNKDDSSEDKRDEENGSNGYENENKQSDNNRKPVKKVCNESYSPGTRESENSEEVVQTVHKNNIKKRHKTGDKDKNSDKDKIDDKDRKIEEDKTAKVYKTISIPTESLQEENSSHNNTDSLIDLLEYEDIFELLSGRGIER